MSVFVMLFFFFFFFSSRRRHTRYWRDWSSDVCSSDLARQPFYRSAAEHPTLFAAAVDKQFLEIDAGGSTKSREIEVLTSYCRNPRTPSPRQAKSTFRQRRSAVCASNVCCRSSGAPRFRRITPKGCRL